MTSIIWCKCGAEYKRTDTKFLVTHKGEAFCDECGAMLEVMGQHPRTLIRTY